MRKRNSCMFFFLLSKLQFRGGRYVADSTSVTADARFKFKCSRAELVLAADPRKLRAAAPRGEWPSFAHGLFGHVANAHVANGHEKLPTV